MPSIQPYSSKSGEMARESLSYSNNSMVMNQNGTLLRPDEIQEMRLNQGFCPTCKGTPVKLYEVRKTKLNPLWKSKEPLTVPNVSYKGLCLVCHPNTQVDDAMKQVNRSSMRSNTSAKTQETSSRSAFVGGSLTVTRLRIRNNAWEVCSIKRRKRRFIPLPINIEIP